MVTLRRLAVAVMAICMLFTLARQTDFSAAQQGGTRASITADSVSDLSLMTEVQPHHREQWSVAFSSGLVQTQSGKLWLATGDYDGMIRLWDASEPGVLSFLGEWEAHARDIYALAFNPVWMSLASSGWDGMVRVWDLEFAPGASSEGAFAPDNVARYRHGEPVYAVTFSPGSGRYLVSGGGYSANEVYVWNLIEGRLQSTPGDHYGWVNDVTFSPDGMFLVSGSGDGAWRQWDMSVGKPDTVVRGHEGPIGGIAFSPDSAVMATSSLDGTIKLWNPVTDELLRTIEVGSFVWRIAYSPDGSLIVGDGRDGSLLFWDATTGELLTTLQAHNRWVNDFAFSPDGSLIASVGEDGLIRLWGVE